MDEKIDENVSQRSLNDASGSEPREACGETEEAIKGAASESDDVPSGSKTEADSEDGEPQDEKVDTPVDLESLHDRVVEQIQTVYDPEIPVNIYDLGMIYEINVDNQANVIVSMTLTSPACPVAGTLPGEVEEKVQSTEGVATGRVDLVWDPPWNPDMMSEAAKLELGMM